MRQLEVVELIASENFPDERVIKACGTEFMNKYAEGYPEKKSVERFKSMFPDYIHTGNIGRYYGGCDCVDMLELYTRYLFQRLFNTDYHVNVQPHSGSQANEAAYEENAFSQYGTMVHGILEEYERGDLAEWELVDCFKERFEKEITKDFPWNAYVDLKESYFNDGVRFFENFDGFKNMKIIDAEHTLRVQLSVSIRSKKQAQQLALRSITRPTFRSFAHLWQQ